MPKPTVTIPAPTPLSQSLYLTEGSSDKEYHAYLKPKGNGWDVSFAYGRRGSALKSDTKTKDPVDFDTAYLIYHDLVASKQKKGYTPDVSGEIFQGVSLGETFSGCLPQLPQTVRDPKDVEALLNDDDVYMQEKHDGDNRQVRLQDTQVSGINKRGMIVPLPMSLVNDVTSLKVTQLLLSAEIIGTTLHVFDLQEINGENLRSQPYKKRLERLEALLSDHTGNLKLVHTVKTTTAKLELVEQIKSQAGEGVVFKKASAPFKEGKRAASEADHFKWKFTEDCTVRVSKVNVGKRSIQIETDHAGKAYPLGNVTIPPNQDIPVAGALVSVVYQHLFEDGSLYQPQYKGVRTDCDGPDTLDMFKIKPKEQARRLAV